MYLWKQLSPSETQYFDLGHAYGLTDTGLVRPSNEDNFFIDSALGLMAVADGMGGHEAGEVASADALTAFTYYLRATSEHLQGSVFLDHAGETERREITQAALATVHHAIEFANQRVYQTNRDNRQADGGGMGTTLTGIWQPHPGAPLLAFHVGDTRLYRLRRGELTQLTRDQTKYQQLFDAGVRRNLPGRNLLLQALGPSGVVTPEVQVHDTAPGDQYLLCSDGLHGVCSTEQIAALLQESDDVAHTCARLVDAAKRNGSRDNITVLLLRCASRH
ncbi:protein phosphatase 2C domain-containing protein [Massilia sp. PAMC28688]|uniref:PP2C family protein-serine/threonine phosphatase n=1 Tax=Massilia sp. PAMC28688 TaxID=2861283 RepID=UPI001C6250B8|nr:protein phosphatase 2C domain-containing protein [Massilia sp. PAMC28688]QYF93290.1 protein phosphatase 2C domain-containing protein [Massilia sp. PAMC28688]